MIWNYIVTMDLGFDCTPVETGDTAWDVADSAVDRINNFLEGEEEEDPPIGTAKERFQSETEELYMRVEIHVTTVAEAGALLTKLKNNIDNFPPPISSALPRYNFTAQAFTETVPE